MIYKNADCLKPDTSGTRNENDNPLFNTANENFTQPQATQVVSVQLDIFIWHCRDAHLDNPHLQKSVSRFRAHFARIIFFVCLPSRFFNFRQ